ncbi:MAG: uracil-DNA glycosylase, partial [Roseibium sp.]
MQTSDTAQRELESLLEFYLASGLDCFLEEDAVDRFALSAELARAQAESRTSAPTRLAAQPAPMQSGVPAQQSRLPATAPATRESGAANAPIAGGAFADAVVPDTEAIHAARDAARNAQTLEELKSCLQAFNGCNLRLTAKNLVFADGNPNGRVMI